LNELKKGKNVVISEGCKVGKNVILEDDVFLDYGCIIRDNVTIKKGTTIGANCIIGEYLSDWYTNHENKSHPLIIGDNSIIRSGCIIYGNTTIGSNFQTGHHVTIRENTYIGSNCSIGSLSDIQGFCTIGNYVRCHSNVHIGQKSVIYDYVWIFPYVVLTNDPTPPSEMLLGVTVENFAVIATGSIILPGVTIEEDSLVAAGAIVTKDVKKNTVVGGNPAKNISTTDRVKNRETGESVYPWRYSYDHNMPWQGIGYDEWIMNHNMS